MEEKQYAYKCSSCNDEFASLKKLDGDEKLYCPYCHSVKCGEPDEDWLPVVNLEEVKLLNEKSNPKNQDEIAMTEIRPSFFGYQGEPKESRYYKRKIRCLLMLGAKCSHCGYDEHPTVLQFHHKRPEEKKYNVTSIMSSMSPLDWENIGINEVKKCELLCSNCHDILHHGRGWGEKVWEQ